jgi:hypothetical protein
MDGVHAAGTMMTAIKLTWKGKEYRIPAEKAFAVGEQVEDVVSLAEIWGWGNKPKFFKIARAYAVMLRFAGCKVSDGDVHKAITDSLLRAAKSGVAGGENLFAVSSIAQLTTVLTMGMTEALGDESEGEATAQATTSD